MDEVHDVMRRAEEMAQRHRLQVNNQRNSIDRLLGRLGSADREAGAREIATLCEKLAIAQRTIERVRAFIKVLREGDANMNGVADDLEGILLGEPH